MILKGLYMLSSCCNVLYFGVNLTSYSLSLCMQARAHYLHTGLPACFRIVFNVLLFAFFIPLFVFLYVKLFFVFYCLFCDFSYLGQPLFLNVLYKYKI